MIDGHGRRRNMTHRQAISLPHRRVVHLGSYRGELNVTRRIERGGELNVARAITSDPPQNQLSSVGAIVPARNKVVMASEDNASTLCSEQRLQFRQLRQR